MRAGKENITKYLSFKVAIDAEFQHFKNRNFMASNFISKLLVLACILMWAVMLFIEENEVLIEKLIEL